ncbi:MULTISPECIES: hypothetical protein [Rhodococcus]|uniref:Uncharacterized protein n=1 Tax=Rhodococcus opacus RKJ300 = JCM 13270 TaxID=1165867 RepID=I0WYW6_RHOOP|nr:MULTISPECIES: hypothetical protein [Rhodococcus]EID81582.1 hypothetical protein W59_02466 [Rhodococcus opacus RKJ300 = JCM 13270]
MVQQGLDLGGGDRLRDAGVVPTGDRRHHCRQQSRCPAAQIQELQQRPQFGHPPLGTADAESFALLDQESDDAFAIERSHVDTAIAAMLFKEPSSELFVSDDRRLGQAAIGNEPCAIICKEHLHRRRR